MGKRKNNTSPVKLSRIWLVAFFVGTLLLAYKLVTDKIMAHVNVVHHALKVETLEISSPQFSVELQAVIVKTKALWDVPSYLLPHSKRTVFIDHIFRGLEYEGLVTYSDVLGRDRTFTLTKVEREARLAFSKMFYRGSPNVLEIDPGQAIFKDGLLKKIESPEIRLNTDGQIFVGQNMVMTVGVDTHEVTFHFDSLTFEKQTIENLTLTINTNLLIPNVKKLELSHIEGKGKLKDANFDFMWSESKDDDNQLKLSGYGMIPLAAFKSIVTPMKQRFLQTQRAQIVAGQDKMKLLQFDLLKKLNLRSYEKQFITRFIPEGYYRKDKTYFHFDIRPDAILREIPQPKNAETYFKLAKAESGKKSVRYLRNSCGLGHSEACFKLGSLTESTSENKSSSLPFYELGCSLKHKDSCKKAKLLSTNN